MSRKHGKEHHEEHMDETWLIPYADLLTLLLALFIVLFASSNVDKAKFAAIAQAFNSEFGSAGVLPPDGGVGFDPNFPLHPSSRPSPTPTGNDDIEGQYEENELHNLQELQIILEEYFEEEGLNANIGMHIDERGLVISFNNSVLFDSGKANIRSEYIPMLTKMGTIINRLGHHIRVEGHTDNLPIHTIQFPTNWELSLFRATTVVRLFTDSSNIEPKTLAAVGYGESRPVATNDTVEGRAQNRRVDVIILNTKFDSLEKEASKAPASTQAP